MTIEDEIDELMDYSRSIAEVAESESDEANRMSAEYFADYYKQLAEWLKELIERRKQPEIIYCKDCEWYKTHSSWNCKKYYYCARESITATVKTENDFCSKAERKIDGD